MPLIRELSEHLTNQIAAGEVIERPASVVKELIENAIDAGSTRIHVQVEEAGLKKIVVSDNGSGIAPDEVELAFQRHATSKIYTQNDLFRIHSLGFRGEALPSIASVAHVQIETSVENEVGVRLRMEGGKVKEHTLHPIQTGTSITVENLFFNTPARLKYIKSVQTELAHITDLLNRFSLSNPSIAFHYQHDGQTLLRTVGSGALKQAIAGVYGPQNARQMMELFAENLDFKITGYASKPELTRANRNSVTTVVNGRFIRNYAIQKAIVDGYGERLMVGRFPIAVLHIEIDPQLLDVNVHPSKREIRISKENELSALIQSSIQEALAKIEAIPTGLKEWRFNSTSTDAQEMKATYEPLDLSQTGAQVQNDQTPSGFDLHESTREFIKDEVPASPTKEVPATTTFPTLYYFGQMHGTYLFAQNESGLYMIDQHAAQERIKYEYYRKKIAEVEPTYQELLVPITLDFTSDEAIRLKSHQEKLEELGIHLELFGTNSFLLQRHPSWFERGQEEAIVQDIIQMILVETNVTIEKLREETAIMMSCKRSIKANHYLSSVEARALLQDLAQTENPYNCPHGRPVLVHLTNQDMEKLFKRIQDPH